MSVLGYSSRFSTPFKGPYLSPVQARGTAQILNYAKEKGFLQPVSCEVRDSCHKVAALSHRIVSPFERMDKTVKLNQVMRCLDVKSLGRLSAVNHHFRNYKSEALEKRGDAVSDLLYYLRGNLKRPYPGDKEVLATVQSLNLSNIRLNPEKIATIVRLCPRLRELDLSDCNITDNCLAALAPLEELLTSLNLKNSDVTDRGIRHLQGFSQLRTLVLPGVYTEAAFTSIATLTQLEKLQLDYSSRDVAISEEGVERLTAQLTHLKECIFDTGFYLSDGAKRKLPLFTKLEVLKIYCADNFSEEDLQEIGKMKNLKELEIAVGAGAETRLDPLCKLTNLQRLSLRGISSDLKNGLARLLPVITNLTELTLEDCDLTDKELMDILVQCPQLKKVCLKGASRITGAEVHRLSSLETIEFLMCPELQDIVFNGLAQCKNLTELALKWCPRITAAELEKVETYGLKRLTIKQHSGIRTAGFQGILNKCPQLRHLVLTNFEVGCSLEEIIPFCRGLQTIKIEMDGVTNRHLQKLGDLPHLVHIDYCTIDDEDDSCEDISDETKRILKTRLPDLILTLDGKKELFSKIDATSSDSDSDSSSGSDSDDD